MSSTRKIFNFKSAFLLILLAVLISCNTTLKANDINTTDLDNLEINENHEDTAHEKSDDAEGSGNFFTFEWQQYTVAAGDTISEIAKRYGISADAIIASNKLFDIKIIPPGMILRIPNIDGILYQLEENDSFVEIAAKFNVPLEIILEVNEINYDNIKNGEIIFIPGIAENEIEPQFTQEDFFTYPLNTQIITSYFGNRRINYAIRFHDGVDFSARVGETVMAAMDGIVTIAVFHRQHGNYIVISHSNGYRTLYSHLSLISVKEGDIVKKGQKIGESGNTGNSTGPHLHFSIYDPENNAINPLDLLRERTVSGE